MHILNRREQLERKAKAAGVGIATWRPGDGVTRFRFGPLDLDYNDGRHLTTCQGLKEAHMYLNGYLAGLVAAGRKIDWPEY